MSTSITVNSASTLLDAVRDAVPEIVVEGTISGVPMVTLAPGVRITGGTLQFGAKGLRLSSDNVVDGVTVITSDHEIAILNDTSVSDLGTLTLRNVTTRGQVFLVAEDGVRAGHVVVDGLTVLSADVRGRSTRPHGFGVDALQGAFTLWNRQADPGVVITAELTGIAIGSEKEPARGSGVFVGGHGDWNGMADGGVTRVSRLGTNAIFTDGGISAGTPDLISGGVFVISGAVVDEVVNTGPVTTLGQNDMVLDNWGEVKTWTALGEVTSRGPSGIGFVNFGAIDRLDVRGAIKTFGTGARGFNVYDGSLRHASFESITTFGDGSVGVQVSKSLPLLEVAHDIVTNGGEGTSLVKGVQIMLKAVALSVKPGGHVGEVRVGGSIATHGSDVVSLEIEGEIDTITADSIGADGAGSDAVHVHAQGPSLEGIRIHSEHGEAVVVS